MNRIPKIIAAFIILFSCFCMQAQDSILKRQKEIYVSFADISPLNISIRLKRQVVKNTYFRIGLVSLSAAINRTDPGNSLSFPLESENYSGGLEIGTEWRKAMTKRLTLFHGPGLRGLCYYSVNKNLNPGIPQPQQKTTSVNYMVSIPYEIGLLVNIQNDFYAAVEITPSLYGNYRKNPDRSGYNFNGGFGFNNNYALISIVYRF